MKKNYFILLLITTVIVSITNAQQTIYSDDFETGYTADSEIESTDTSWLIAGTGFTFPAKNVASGGAASSNWYVRMERGGTANYAYIERVYTLTAGKTYEFKASVFPDASGQKNAYNLKVLDGNNTEQVASANPTTGSTWEELSVSYTAAETKNYKFRVQKTWGNQGASIDNYSIVCTTCASPTVTYDGTSWDSGSPIGTTDTSKDVIITSGNVAFSGTSSFKSLTINAGASVTLPTGNSITTVDGTVLDAGASLIAEGTSTVTGNVTYNRNLATTNWYLMSSPVVGETYDDTYVTANSIASGTVDNRGIALYTSSNDSWDYMQSGETATFTSGNGYSVKRSATGDISFTGTLNVADVGVTLSNDGNRFNLLGNPYTSYINSGTFLANAALSETQTIWVYDQTLSTNGSYVVKTLAENFILAPGQGFFVKANAAGGSVNFAETNQSHTSDTFQKTSKTEVTIQLSVNGAMQYAKLYYLNTATTGFDVGYEGEVFGGTTDEFSIYTQLLTDNVGKKYQVQSLPNSEYESMVIPVGVKAAANKEIIISAEALNLPEDVNVFLEDKQTNTFTRLDEANSNYKITLTEDLDGIGRFYLHTTSSVLNTDKVAINNNISIYTSSKDLHIIGVQDGITKVSLYNILGKQILHTSFKGNGVNTIPLPNFNSGVYIVQLETETRIVNKKIILE